MDCDLETTRRRVALLARIVAHHRRIAKEEGTVALGVRALADLEEASQRLAATAATMVAGFRDAGGDPLGKDDPAAARRRYLRAVGASGAFPCLDSLAAQLRTSVPGAPPTTPDRALAHGEFMQALRMWDREAAAAAEEIGRARCATVEELPPDADTLAAADALLAAAEGEKEGEKKRGGGGSHDASVTRHFNRWLQRILGQETHPDVGAVGDRVVALAADEHLTPARLDVYKVREYLARLKRNDLYNYAAAIMHYVTGVHPPVIRAEVLDRAAALFAEVVRVRRTVLKRTEGVQSYPYFIYKIFESVIPPDDPARRVLFYIFLQGSDTLIRRDNEWARICRQVPALQLNLPTSHRAAARYAPTLPEKPRASSVSGASAASAASGVSTSSAVSSGPVATVTPVASGVPAATVAAP